MPINFDRPIPLFPLASVVLLPGATVPLHIFEQRYRDMTNAAIDSTGLIAMATLAGQSSDWASNYEGRPPLQPAVCIGYVMRHEQLPDGRFNILLQGLARATIQHELPGESFRLAKLSPIQEQRGNDDDLAGERHRLDALLDHPALARNNDIQAIHNWLSDEIPTAQMIDLVTLVLCKENHVRYEALAEGDACLRAARLRHYLDTLRQAAEEVEEAGVPVSTIGAAPRNRSAGKSTRKSTRSPRSDLGLN